MCGSPLCRRADALLMDERQRLRRPRGPRRAGLGTRPRSRSRKPARPRTVIRSSTCCPAAGIGRSARTWPAGGASGSVTAATAAAACCMATSPSTSASWSRSSKTRRAASAVRRSTDTGATAPSDPARRTRACSTSSRRRAASRAVADGGVGLRPGGAARGSEGPRHSSQECYSCSSDPWVWACVHRGKGGQRGGRIRRGTGEVRHLGFSL